jgi:hypothetical protein
MTNTNFLTKRPRATGALLIASAAVLMTVLSGCAPASGGTTPAAETKAAETVQTPAAGAPSVLWIGDSVAENEAPALEAALTAAGASFINQSSAGGGTVVDSGGKVSEIAQNSWKTVSGAIEKTKPNTVVYQITTYDWGTPEQQEAGYQKLADEAESVGADLVIVSMPPIVIDEFYAPYAAEMATAPDSARAVAEGSDGKVTFLDASALWGTDASATKAQRGTDGIHACQQASASFAAWFMTEFAKTSGLKPAAPESWATGEWTSAETYAKYDCATGGK